MTSRRMPRAPLLMLAMSASTRALPATPQSVRSEGPASPALLPAGVSGSPVQPHREEGTYPNAQEGRDSQAYRSCTLRPHRHHCHSASRDRDGAQRNGSGHQRRVQHHSAACSGRDHRVVALLVAILPGFITGVGNQQHQQNTLSAACVASSYKVSLVQPHVEQAAVSLQPVHLPTRRPR